MEKPSYPFFKLTLDEKFPRLLITRRPENKLADQAIYGAFLPDGLARRMLDLLQKLFRLRPCEFDIQGDFDAPCPEYFLHRCLAPCVAPLCSRETYFEAVEIVHLILSSQYEAALQIIDRKIEHFSEDLEYELAAEWHNIKRIISEIHANAKWQIDVSAMNDVITITRQDKYSQIQLTTLRRGKAVGRLYFQTAEIDDNQKIIAEFIRGFYGFYAPKQIFVPEDFPERKALEANLSAKFGRKIKIIAQMPDKLPVSVSKTQTLASYSFRHKNGQSIAGKSNCLKS